MQTVGIVGLGALGVLFGQRLLENGADWERRITDIFDRTIANFGHSGEAGGKYVADTIRKKREKRQ